MARPFPAVIAAEIDGDDAAWLRGETLPDGYELAEVDEVEFYGRVYDRAPGSVLYVPTSDDAVARVVDRVTAQLEIAEPEPEPAPVGISLFTGCGGFDLGMTEAGIDVVAASEWDAAAAQTYLFNLGHPDCAIHFATDADRRRWEKARLRAMRRRAPSPGASDVWSDGWIGSAARASRGYAGGCRAFFFGDVRHVSGRQMMDAAGVDDVDVLFGGPPCQGLSTANSKACLEDPRNGLISEFMRMVHEIRPHTFIIENVPAILTVAKGALFNAIARLANEAGYNVTATKLDAVHYGVPQHRLRAIIVGTREGEPRYRFPMPTTWALGRPAHDDGWQVGGEAAGLDRSLPDEARFDPATRTWTVGARLEVPATQQGPAPAAQPDLFGGAA